MSGATDQIFPTFSELFSQNFSPTALLRNFASGDIFLQARANVVMNIGLQTWASEKSTDVPRSLCLRSSTNSWSEGNPRGGRERRLASSQLRSLRRGRHSLGRSTMALRTFSS